MVLIAAVALAMLASSLWMAIGPQLPPFRARRTALTGLTWLLSRAAYAAFALRMAGAEPGARAHALLSVAGLGAVAAPGAGLAAGPLDLPGAIGVWTAFVIAVDFAAWRALAAADGEGSEAAWNWVASPLSLWIGVVLGAPRVAAVALVALAYLLQRRARDAAAGLALGAAAALGGPAALAVALALALAPGRRVARLPWAAVAAAVVLFALRLGAPAPWEWSWWPPAAPAGGVSLWRLVHAFAGVSPPGWTWLPCGALVAAGYARLARRGAPAPALAAWGFAAFAASAPTLPVRWLLPFAPLLAVWAADDPDRRGWWFLECLALSLSVVLELLAFHEQSRLTWRLIAVAGIGAAALLGLWPLRASLTLSVATAARVGSEVAEPTSRGARPRP